MENNKNTNRNPISTNPETTMTMDELKEEFFKSARMCEACPHWLSCSSYPTVAAIAAFLQERDEEEAEDENEEDPLLRAPVPACKILLSVRPWSWRFQDLC